MVVCRTTWKSDTRPQPVMDAGSRREGGPIFLHRRAPSAHALALLAATGHPVAQRPERPAAEPAAPHLRLVS